MAFSRAALPAIEGKLAVYHRLLIKNVTPPQTSGKRTRAVVRSDDGTLFSTRVPMDPLCATEVSAFAASSAQRSAGPAPTVTPDRLPR
jgi:hypothetical protein